MTRAILVLVALLAVSPAFAQQAARPAAPAAPAATTDAQLHLIVVDVTESGIPTANITITAPGREPIEVMTDEKGVVTVPSLPVGDVKVHVEFSGFEPADGVVRLQRGMNNQTVELKLAGLSQEVNVSSEDVLADTRGSAMATSLSKEEISALPDDQEELQRYLEQLAGPEGATFVMNGFRGGRLPSKEEIRAIRIRSNSFAADGHESGGRQQIEIITRPNTGAYSGGFNVAYQGGNLNARNAQSREETPESNKQVQLQFRGPIVRDKTSFNLNVQNNNRYTSNSIIAVSANGTQVKVPTETQNISGGIEHALTKNSTLRLSYQGQRSEGRNQGLTQFDLPERAQTTRNTGNMYRAQVQGIVGTNMLNEVRFEVNRRRQETSSVTNAAAILIPEVENRGGAGVTRNNLTQTFELADNFDFTPFRNHQMRVGLLLEGGLYENFDETNPLGRTTYGSLPEYNIDLKLQHTQRLGTYTSSFTQYQAGMYIQDDIRVNNHLSVGVGLRNEMQTRIDDKLNLMPRVGFSLNPFSGNRTSIRGGYGIYYDWYEANLYDQTLRLNGVAQQDYTTLFEYAGAFNELGIFVPTLDANGKAILLGTTGGVGSGPSNRTVAAPGLELPYVHQTSIGVQQQLATNLSLQVTYQKLVGRNQYRGIDINYGELVFDGVNFVRVRPDPTSNIVTEIQSTGRSESDRLTFQTRYQLPNSRGFFQFSYQLGQAKSDFTGATSLPSDSAHPELDWGPQGQDIRHQVQLGGSIRLPWQIRLQSQLNVRSAPAYNFTTGSDNNKDGVVNDRFEGVSRNSLRGESTWEIRQASISKIIGFGGPRADGGGNQGGGGFRGGNNQQGGGGFGGGGFQGGGNQGGGGGFPGGGNFRGNNNNSGNNSRYQVEFAISAQNPLNRVVRTGYTGNIRSPFFGTATTINPARKITFNTSFRF
ncbi:MAG TPA: carboxypeptidase-like regulatory domain-containing protein [Vicinamibacterales bacterium]|nr:carboxypeptidase-like regulatory domain-containing protein [Vicinamibacterales bacterium]